MPIQSLVSLVTGAALPTNRATRATTPKRPAAPLTVNQAPANTPWWGDYGAVWDVVRIAGIELPGVATVTGKGFEQKMDRRVIPGQKGKRFNHYGCDPADVEITLQLWEPEHLDGLKRLISIIKPKNGKATAHSIYHPALDLYQIRSVLVMSSSLPAMSHRGVMEVTLRCEEYVTPADASKSAVANVTQGPDAAGSMAGGRFKNAIAEKVDANAAKNAKKPSTDAAASAP